MHVVHHAVEVDALLPLDVEALEEQVHEEGLATTDAAPDVETAHGLVGPAAAEHLAQHAASRRLSYQTRPQVFEPRDQVELRGVLDVSLALQTLHVGLADTHDYLNTGIDRFVAQRKITCLIPYGQ